MTIADTPPSIDFPLPCGEDRRIPDLFNTDSQASRVYILSTVAPFLQAHYGVTLDDVTLTAIAGRFFLFFPDPTAHALTPTPYRTALLTVLPDTSTAGFTLATV